MPSLTPNDDRDARLLRSLFLLTKGNVNEFADCTQPTEEVRKYLRRADASEIRGLLLETLTRWHEINEK